MNRKEEILDFLQKHKEEIHRRFHVKEIALFGSFARDDQNERSDIDLILEFDDRVQNLYQLKKEIRSYLQHHLHRPVDLARKKYLKPYAKEAILRDAIFI